MNYWLSTGDDIGWALDSDRETVMTAFSSQGWVHTSRQDAAALVYIWPGALIRDYIAGVIDSTKLIICGLDNPMYIWGTINHFYEASRLVDYFICRNKHQIAEVKSLGCQYFYIPYRSDFYTNIAGFGCRSERVGLPTFGNHMRDSSLTENGIWVQKKQKNPGFLALLANDLVNVGVLRIAGVRRHALVNALQQYGSKYEYLGDKKLLQGDDIFTKNRMNRDAVVDYLTSLDVFVVTSQWEGGPYGSLEALECGVPVVSTAVGFYPDISPPEFCAENYHDIRRNLLLVLNSSNAREDLYSFQIERLRRQSPFSFGADPQGGVVKSVRLNVILREPKRQSLIERSKTAIRSKISPELQNKIKSSLLKRNITLPQRITFTSANFGSMRRKVSILREFYKPPYGGGNQFLISLAKKFEEMGISVYNNIVDETISHYIIDSSWLDKDVERRLRELKSKNRSRVRVLHRIDGAVSIYRGIDEGEDARISELNVEFADITILQSFFSWVSTNSIGSTFKNPVIVRNAAADIFHDAAITRSPVRSGGEIRLVASAWSPNPKKGAAMYERIADNLPRGFAFTFIGNFSSTRSNISVIAPLEPVDLARELSNHDLFVTASELDSCSNSVLEALAVGLPVAYINSGGHSEIVGLSGFAFNSAEEFLRKISLYKDTVREWRLSAQDQMEEVAGKYAYAMFN